MDRDVPHRLSGALTMYRIMADSLNRAWIILMVLTLLSLGAGLRDDFGHMGDAAILIITLIKGRQVLIHFLEIRKSHFGWLLLFSLWLVVVGCASLGAVILTRS